jgi:hypothetical protein
MQNPFGSQQVPGSYFNLQKRILKRVQDAKVNDRIFEIVQTAYQTAYEEALAAENVVLSRPERQRLFSHILKLVLDDILKRVDNRSGST